MSNYNDVAQNFLAMAHEIVWCTVATVDPQGRPRSRVLHPIWEWDGKQLTGWIATGRTPIKQADIAQSAHVSCNYWTPSQDTCVAECEAEWVESAALKHQVWDTYVNGPAPVGYNPGMIPGWDNADSPAFDALKLTPFRLRVMPGESLMNGTYASESWSR
jgi:general stress protein 26